MSDAKTTVMNREMRMDVPLADIFETKDGLVIRADMPGVDRDSLDITVERSVLTLTGRIRHETPEGYELVYSEYGIDGYERSFTLSDEFDLGKVRAEFRNGVLEISVPKSEAAKPRKIEVK
jgi:HSP20 family molecular chaperone IbpA